MASVNKVTILGNCGRDPEVRYLPSGGAVANVSIATTSRRRDKSSGEWIVDTQWHRAVFFERLAEIVGEYVKKGDPIYIEGRLKYGTYKDGAGVEKATTDIVVTELQLLGSRNEGQSGNQSQPRQNAGQGANNSQGNNRQQSNAGSGYRSNQGAAPPYKKPIDQGGTVDGEFDDDIPF